MASQSLQIGDSSSSPSFVQQGQVDWVAFANSTISSSVAVMQRFSAAGVQPVTVAGGLALGSRFELSKKGEQNMDIALKKLNGVFGFDKLLYYGFGYRSFVNVLAETKVGVNLVALCSCLVEMHGISFSAEVLAALWKREAFPENFEPSMSQFNALTTACAGVVSSSVFGEVGDMMLGDLRSILDKSRTKFFGRSISPPEDVARALHGLFQVSRGVHEQIEILGGPNCAFIGAFASWLLDLNLHIEDDNGTLIYLDAPNREGAQVRIRYCSMTQMFKKLVIVSSTYVLRDSESMFHRNSYQNEELSFSVRTSWDGCLNRVFWNATPRLIGVSQILGEFLGNTARIYAALARGEAEVGSFLREYFEDFVDGMHGRGFIESVGKIFPELNNVAELESVMLTASNKTFDQALTNLRAAVDALISLCGCDFCKGLADGSPPRGEGKGIDRHCLLSTAMTIGSLVRLVAGLVLHDTINPTIAGLQQIYYLCQGRLEVDARLGQGAIPLYAILDLASSDDPHVGRVDFSKDYMGKAHCLFTGCFPSTSAEGDVACRLAFSFNGICCYMESLQDLGCNPVTLGRIHLLAGHIQRDDREYREVRDISCDYEYSLPEAKLSLSNTNIPSKLRDEKFQIKGIAREVIGGNSLGFCYELSSDRIKMRISPSYIRDVLRRTGLITCDKITCANQFAIPCNVVQEGWELPIGQREPEECNGCYVWPFQENDVCRCVALVAVWVSATGNMRYQLDQKIYWRNGECLPCCTKAVSEKQFSIII
ncbi:MAG: hypothetical protein Q9160_005550 [Pyrenula sp. 1 TL-2023]